MNQSIHDLLKHSIDGGELTPLRYSDEMKLTDHLKAGIFGIDDILIYLFKKISKKPVNVRSAEKAHTLGLQIRGIAIDLKEDILHEDQKFNVFSKRNLVATNFALGLRGMRAALNYKPSRMPIEHSEMAPKPKNQNIRETLRYGGAGLFLHPAQKAVEQELFKGFKKKPIIDAA